MKKVLVLGCTGSIGTSALDVVRAFPRDYKVCALVAHKSKAKAKMLAAEFACPYAITLEDEDCVRRLIEETKPDIAINGISGSAGLVPSEIVIEHGVDLALANKETVVMAWPIIREKAKRTGAKIIPVDSEHSAVFNLLERVGKRNVAKVIITASGGPFRETKKEDLPHVSVEDALKHPTWNMGKKITVDSATLANKGLEVIEAVRLFDLPCESVEVAVHPQSVVHSLVQTIDGMLYAQMSEPDMRHPILSALSWPVMLDARGNLKQPVTNGDICAAEGRHGALGMQWKSALDILSAPLSFMPPRMDDFEMLPLAYEAVRLGGAYTIAYNAANEAAVASFIDGTIGFTDIAAVTKAVLDGQWLKVPESIDEVLDIDIRARQAAERIIGGGKR